MKIERLKEIFLENGYFVREGEEEVILKCVKAAINFDSKEKNEFIRAVFEDGACCPEIEDLAIKKGIARRVEKFKPCDTHSRCVCARNFREQDFQEGVPCVKLFYEKL